MSIVRGSNPAASPTGAAKNGTFDAVIARAWRRSQLRALDLLGGAEPRGVEVLGRRRVRPHDLVVVDRLQDSDALIGYVRRQPWTTGR